MVARIAFIGPGVMAEAMIGGLIRQKLEKPEDLIAAGPRPERLQELQKRYGIHVEGDNAQAARKAEIVVLSVKPQKLDKVLAGLRGSIPAEALVVSIVAGAPIEKLMQGLNHPYIVR
jgi:pyrroline-5-carboxylate reductase